MFAAFGVETLRAWGLDAHTFYRDVTKLLIDVSRDEKAAAYNLQGTTIAIQRGDVASLLETIPVASWGQLFIFSFRFNIFY